MVSGFAALRPPEALRAPGSIPQGQGGIGAEKMSLKRLRVPTTGIQDWPDLWRCRQRLHVRRRLGDIDAHGCQERTPMPVEGSLWVYLPQVLALAPKRQHAL